MGDVDPRIVVGHLPLGNHLTGEGCAMRIGDLDKEVLGIADHIIIDRSYGHGSGGFTDAKGDTTAALAR